MTKNLRRLVSIVVLLIVPVVSSAAPWSWRANRPPSISGVPATSVVVGSTYRFTPTASDPEHRALTFKISNRPAWATFDTTNGRLQGTPQSADVGNFPNIVISVSDGRSTASLSPFNIAVNGGSNQAPTISGTPPTSAMPGTLYRFQPTASDANGDPLTFSIVHKPAWATFSTSTGGLQGTPSAADVGTTSGIVIAVSDGKASAALPTFNVTVQATATGSATLSWQPPTANSDGSPLTDLAGYRVYWGTTQGSYPNVVPVSAGLATYVVSNLLPGKYFFVTTAINKGGAESQLSNVVSKTIQ